VRGSRVATPRRSVGFAPSVASESSAPDSPRENRSNTAHLQENEDLISLLQGIKKQMEVLALRMDTLEAVQDELNQRASRR
jgi:hypothetical protein